MTRTMRRTIVVSLALVSLLVMTMPANAIIDGSPDGNRHPNAGALMLDEQFAFCSGFLISPRYVATAGHCADDAVLAELGLSLDDVSVTFDDQPDADSTYYPVAAWFQHPEYAFPYNDYGLVELARPVRGVPEADLPPVGAADRFAKGQEFEVVGYGATDVHARTYTYPQTRNFVTLTLYPGSIPGGVEVLKVGAPKASGCFGDSGGPGYLPGDIRVVWGISSAVTDPQCSGMSYGARTDTAAAASFYGDFD